MNRHHKIIADLTERVQRMAHEDTENFSDLAAILGLDPRADFSLADLSGLALVAQNFLGCDFAGSSFAESDLSRSSMNDCDLNGALLAGSQLDYAVIHGCKFREADLSEAVFQGTVLDNCDFSGANLVGAYFPKTAIRECVLTGAVLTGARFENAALAEVDFTGIDLEGVQFEKCAFNNVRGLPPSFATEYVITEDTRISRRGFILSVSSPSNADRTSIMRALISEDSKLVPSIPCTTRAPKPGEGDGSDYIYLTIDQFAAMVAADDFLEHARLSDDYYGTPRREVVEALANGRDVLIDSGWIGAQQIAQNMRADLVTVFILPSSAQEAGTLGPRMAERDTDSSHWVEADYVLIDDDPERSVARMRSILDAERLKRDRHVGMAAFVNGLRTRTEAWRK